MLRGGGLMAKILVVDDEKDVIARFRLLLEKEGHEVVAAIDGNAAVEKAKSLLPDLIILDIMMPKLDGYAVHAQLSEDPSTRPIPIIILTDKSQMKEVFAASSSVVSYFNKTPFDSRLFRQKVKEVLETK